MGNPWWQLPGPARFVEEITGDVRDGRNIALLLPEHSSAGLFDHLRRELNERDGFRWVNLSLREEHPGNPLDLLFSRFAPNYPEDGLRTIPSLLSETAFLGKAIWVNGITAESWPDWKHFLEKYDQACDACSALERTIFIAELSGKESLDPPREGPRMSHRRLIGKAGSIDAALYAALLVDRRDWNVPRKRITAAIIANVALWDSQLAERMANEKHIERILAPNPILEELSSERGWQETSIYETPAEAWSMGISNSIDGQERLHSSYLAIRKMKQELDSRIWKGQVGVLMPMVEEKRQELLVSLKSHLTVPFQTYSGGVIDNFFDLEIGHIEAQIYRKGSTTGVETQKFVTCLKKIRNCLAHLEVVPPELILFEEFLTGM